MSRNIVWMVEARMRVPGYGTVVHESFAFESEEAALKALPTLVKDFGGKTTFGHEIDHWWVGPEYAHTSDTSLEDLFDVPELEMHVFTPMGIRIYT